MAPHPLKPWFLHPEKVNLVARHPGHARTAISLEDPALNALVLSTISGLSLPLGAILGVLFSPISDSVCSAMMAFGAGALLFAVTVELYGHSLRELKAERMGLMEMFVTIAGALAGAIFYLYIHRVLERTYIKDEEETEDQEEPTFDDESEPASPVSSHSFDSPAKRPRFAYSKSIRGLLAQTRDNNLANNLATIDSSLPLSSSKSMTPQSSTTVQKAKLAATALFFGLLVDGVPEGVLMGFLAAEGHLTPVLVVSLFAANFPEAFSSASLLKVANMSNIAIVGSWTALCGLIGCLGGLSCWALLALYPSYAHADAQLPPGVCITTSVIEGVAGGAMIAFISAVMLPEAFERAGKDGSLLISSGFLCTCGFLMSVAMSALWG